MSQTITISLPDELAKRARAAAERSNRKLEEALVEWIDRGLGATPIDHLSDSEILALCDLQMDAQSQEELSRLLAANREGELKAGEAVRLDELMQTYRRGLIQKGQALNVAVVRGLRPRVA
jgi:hypothetical protein